MGLGKNRAAAPPPVRMQPLPASGRMTAASALPKVVMTDGDVGVAPRLPCSGIPTRFGRTTRGLHGNDAEQMQGRRRAPAFARPNNPPAQCSASKPLADLVMADGFGRTSCAV